MLGVDPAKIPPGQRGVERHGSPYHDPFVLFGFLAGVTKKIGFAAGVLILAQRQAALVAKQAASLDALCEGRFRLGVGVGWNEIEFQGLGMTSTPAAALGGAGALHAGAVGQRAARHLQGQVSTS